MATLLQEKVVVFLINPIESMKQIALFYNELQNSFEDLSEVRFAVCGLQNKRIKSPSRVAYQIDQTLEEHLAQRVVRFVDIDTSAPDQGEGAFERWVAVFCATRGLEPPAIRMVRPYHIRPSRNKSVADSPLRPNGFEIASLKARERITPETAPLKIWKVSLKLPGGLAYKTGNFAVILPMNPSDLVDSVLERMRLAPAQAYRCRRGDESEELLIPELVSARQLFEQYLDLSTCPTRKLVKLFGECASSAGVDDVIQLLAPSNEDGFAAYMKDRTVGDFICEFTEYGVPELEDLVAACPLIKPRYYAVASAPRTKRGMLELYVGEHSFGPDNCREGLCSGFLLSGPKRISIAIRDGFFDYPTDKLTPIIMIAVEVGIGACMSLIQHRKVYDGSFGPALLIFQFPSRKSAEMIIKEIEQFAAPDVLEAIYVFPQDSDSRYKSYQEVLQTETKQIWRLWENPAARLYCAGNLGDAAAEIHRLLVLLTITEGGLRDEEAMAYTARHTCLVRDF
jgi:sulfite reductase alpha subunit-like flavoprotein